jgi:bacillithiol system protein YtxJ
MVRFLPVTDAMAFDALVEHSRTAGTVVFLHDPYCPISAGAYEEMEAVAGEVHLIDVSQPNGLSKVVQAKTGVRHESPQVIILRGGSAAWHASHGRIRTDTVTEALASAGA